MGAGNNVVLTQSRPVTDGLVKEILIGRCAGSLTRTLVDGARVISRPAGKAAGVKRIGVSLRASWSGLILQLGILVTQCAGSCCTSVFLLHRTDMYRRTRTLSYLVALLELRQTQERSTSWVGEQRGRGARHGGLIAS